MAGPTWSLDPNRSASSLEAAFLRDTITADEDLLTTLDARVARSAAAVREAERALAEAQGTLASTRSMHQSISGERDSVLERLGESRGLMHPLRRVPPEVLSQIFLACLDIEGAGQEDLSDEQLHCLTDAPYAVSQVSRHWRSVALQTLRLWTYVSVHFKSPEIGNYNKDWVAQLDVRMRRSAGLPIQLFIDGYFPHHPCDDYPVLPDDYDEVARDWIPPSDLWAPIINALPRCQSIRIVARDNGVLSFHPTAGLLAEDAPILERLHICTRVIHDPDLAPFSTGRRPYAYFNIRAPRLRKLEVLGVQLHYGRDLQSARTYPCLTKLRFQHAQGERGDFVQALLARAPALTRLAVDTAGEERALDWLAHPNVRHIALERSDALRAAVLPLAAGFPLLESVDIATAWLASLENAFAPAGTFHAVRRLAYGAEYLDKALVAVLDLLPNLEAVTLRGATFTQAFVAPDAWARPGATLWRCPRLREVALVELKEAGQVDGAAIVAWLGSRNAPNAGPHAPFSRFELTWAEEVPASLDEGFEAAVGRALSSRGGIIRNTVVV